MTEVQEWLSRSFRRRGPDLAIGPIAHALLLCREDVDELVRGLIDVQSRLPTLEQRLAGLSTCEACDGEGIIHDVEAATEYDCPACEGYCFSPREEEAF